MHRETLKDSRFRVIGYIDTERSGKQTGKDSRFRVVGYYDPQTNETKDERFRVVGRGNLLASLITCS